MNVNTLAMIANSIDLSKFSPKMNLEVRPYKLVIYQEGGHFDQHRDTVRGDNHIGTLVVILNSQYTGGELEISHGGKTAYSWVAMYGDCLHKINPVTSGTRVSLIYDLYAGDGFIAGESYAARERARFIDNKRAEQAIDPDMARPLHERQQQLIFAGVDRELAGTSDVVVICLAHKYPTCQSTPYFLKGGDLALYELLRDHYDVSVEPVSVFTTLDEDHYEGTISAAMIKDVETMIDGAAQAFQQKKPRKTVKFVIPSNLNADSVLDYSPYIEHTGNESQDAETVYVVAGLQVRKRPC